MFTTGETEPDLLGSDLARLGLTFDHIGIVAPDLASSRRFFSLALGISEWTEPVDDPAIGVSVQFGRGQDISSTPTFELIAPLGNGSPISNALRGNKHILNHFAYRTFSLRRAGDHLRDLGCVSVAPAHPSVAYHGECIQFWITPMRFLLELIEAPAHQHSFAAPPPTRNGQPRTNGNGQPKANGNGQPKANGNGRSNGGSNGHGGHAL